MKKRDRYKFNNVDYYYGQCTINKHTARHKDLLYNYKNIIEWISSFSVKK